MTSSPRGRRHLRLPIRPARAEGLLRRARLIRRSPGRRASSAPIASRRRCATYVRDAEARGVRIFVGAAGMAAHLPGVLASHDRATGDRRAARRRRAGWRRCALQRRADAARRAGGARSPSAPAGRRTPRTWPPASWRLATRSWPRGWRRCARRLADGSRAGHRPQMIDRYALPELRELFSRAAQAGPLAADRAAGGGGAARGRAGARR